MSDTQNVKGKAIVDFETGRGFGDVSTGLPEDFLEGDKQTVLVTIATIFTHPNPMSLTMEAQAVAYLALFAAGAQVALTKQQFRQLERRVETYESWMRGISRQRNEAFAAYVRKHAVRRAKAAGII
jgi:hypothetical protein